MDGDVQMVILKVPGLMLFEYRKNSVHPVTTGLKC